MEANGIRVLYESAQDVIECREMESLILLASVIMRKCCPRNKLPICNVRSVVMFDKPVSEMYPEEGTEGTKFSENGLLTVDATLFLRVSTV